VACYRVTFTLPLLTVHHGNVAQLGSKYELPHWERKKDSRKERKTQQLETEFVNPTFYSTNAGALNY
jgi:hypothetical protein